VAEFPFPPAPPFPIPPGSVSTPPIFNPVWHPPITDPAELARLAQQLPESLRPPVVTTPLPPIVGPSSPLPSPTIPTQPTPPLPQPTPPVSTPTPPAGATPPPAGGGLSDESIRAQAERARADTQVRRSAPPKKPPFIEGEILERSRIPAGIGRIAGKILGPIGVMIDIFTPTKLGKGERDPVEVAADIERELERAELERARLEEAVRAAHERAFPTPRIPEPTLPPLPAPPVPSIPIPAPRPIPTRPAPARSPSPVPAPTRQRVPAPAPPPWAVVASNIGDAVLQRVVSRPRTRRSAWTVPNSLLSTPTVTNPLTPTSPFTPAVPSTPTIPSTPTVPGTPVTPFTPGFPSPLTPINPGVSSSAPPFTPTRSRTDRCDCKPKRKKPERKCRARAPIVWAGGPRKGQQAGTRCFSWED
jgi:hypothetical protein